MRLEHLQHVTSEWSNCVGVGCGSLSTCDSLSSSVNLATSAQPDGSVDASANTSSHTQP